MQQKIYGAKLPIKNNRLNIKFYIPIYLTIEKPIYITHKKNCHTFL